MRLPTLFAFDGGNLPTLYAWGYWTGPGGDLLCVLPDLGNADAAEYALSPVCHSRLLALVAFLAKRFVLAVDDNARLLLKGEAVRRGRGV